MTVEEALVGLLALAALVLLFLGLAEALDARGTGSALGRRRAPLDEVEPRRPLRSEPAESPPRLPERPPPPAGLSPGASPFARRPARPAGPSIPAGPVIAPPAPPAAPRGDTRSWASFAEPLRQPAALPTGRQAAGAAEPRVAEGAGKALVSACPPVLLEGAPVAVEAVAAAAVEAEAAASGAPVGAPEAPWAGAAAAEPARAATETSAEAETPTAVLERCAALYLGGRHGELLALAEPHLAREGAGDWGGVQGSALASLAGVSRRELGDREAAGLLMARAAAHAPTAPAESCPPLIAALAVPVARRLLEAAGAPGSHSPEARVARVWLRWRLVAAPGDPDALALLDAARGAVGAAVGEDVAGHLRARDWAAARRAVHDAAERGDIDAARVQILDRMITSAVKREVERLVTPAIRGGRDERRAVDALGQAEELLGSLPPDVLTPAQRTALGRRVAWAHARLGIHRVRSGSLETGVEALGEALRARNLGPERLRRVRETLVEALDGLAARADAAIGQPGGRGAAADLARDLEQRIGCARDLGVPARLLARLEERAAQLTRGPDQPPSP